MPRRSKPNIGGHETLFDQAIHDLAQGIELAGALEDARYQQDPVAFLHDRLGVRENTIVWSKNRGYDDHRWDGTEDPLAAVLHGLARSRNVGVESATGTGKTFLGACVVLWFLACFERSLVVTTAPKEQQLTLHLWKEVGRLWPRFKSHYDGAGLIKLQLRMRPGDDEWTAVGFACGVGAAEASATRAQGFHAEHMLIITEETPGIHAAVMTAFENTCTAPHNLRLAFGNPDHQLDELHKFCIKTNVTHVRISALDHPNVVCNNPNVVPGAVSKEKVEDRRVTYGEDSRIFQSRARGICPAESADALIRLEWCRQAALRNDHQNLRTGPAGLGVDVANSLRGDQAALARGLGATLLNVRSFACPDANRLGRLVALEMSAHEIDMIHVGVDPIGVGAGTVNELKRLGHRVQALNGAARPIVVPKQQELFLNLRAQMWWKMRMDLQHGRIALPDDDELFMDLTTPQWTTRGGKIIVESKEDMRKRLGRSPDKGDAAVYWNWVREHVGGASEGARLVTF